MQIEHTQGSLVVERPGALAGASPGGLRHGLDASQRRGDPRAESLGVQRAGDPQGGPASTMIDASAITAIVRLRCGKLPRLMGVPGGN
jgi:hypothetical protein